MYFLKLSVKITTLIFVLANLASCSEKSSLTAASLSHEKSAGLAEQHLDVHKSPTCACCEKWIEHIDASVFKSTSHNYQDVSVIKTKAGIAPRYRSCHTAIAKNGYVFEGHVPAKFIHQFSHEAHNQDVIGLSVPGMPIGSPGMDFSDKFMPYDILLLKSDGSYEVYAHVNSYEEQF